MKRAQLLLIAPLFLFVACQSQSLTTPTPGTSQLIPAVAVNDPCSFHTTEADCKGSLGLCAWTPVAACPAGATCPPGACVSPDSCAGLTTATACQANANCAWSTVAGTTAAPALCPVGQDCGGGGFCFQPPSTGNTCLCVQPLVCPANGPCPPVQCDCPPPAPVDAGSSGGGTCTCGCPACLPGEACPPCDCQCGTGGGTGGAGGSGGGCGTGAGGSTGSGTGTCTCNCPECPVGAECPACSCSCSSGATTTMTVPSSGSGTTGPATTTNSGAPSISVCTCPACPPNAACAPCDCAAPPPADPCTSYTDAKSCAADTADACGWTALTIECLTTPCPTGACARMQPVVTVDGGSGSGVGGCGCACPACPAGSTCPACTCNCCGGQPLPPVGVTPKVTGDAGTTPPPAGTPILL